MPGVEAYGQHNLLFVENKGQVTGLDGIQRPEIHFVAKTPGMKIFLGTNTIYYQFSRTVFPPGYEQRPHPGQDRKLQDSLRHLVQVSTSRFSICLLGANPTAHLRSEVPEAYVESYFTGKTAEEITGLKSYTKVVYEEIYPGIDWVIYTQAAELKYDFVLRPGADPTLIRFRINDADSSYIGEHGELIMTSALGKVIDKAPVSYSEGHAVPTRFVKAVDGSISFSIGSYDHLRGLTIDPRIVWGSYYGGTNDELVNGCAVDSSGNIYLAGTTESFSGIASGGFQNTIGGIDPHAFLVKLNSAGVRQWATYYGGSSYDQGFSCAVDHDSIVYLAGVTESSGLATSSGFQTSFNGYTDGFLVKFSDNGTRQWATYFGGGYYDEARNCTVDNHGNVYLGGFSSSLNLSVSGGFQSTMGGPQDAFLAKFNRSGNMLWSTYYGGSGEEYGLGCTVDNADNVFLTGMTKSTAGVASAGFQNTYGGGNTDAFLVKFDSSGNRLWGTYYGGTGQEIGYQCTTDRSRNVFLGGLTSSTSGIAFNGFQSLFGGGYFYDAFLVKFNSAGARVWDTYYGGSGDDEGLACVADGSGNVCLAGYTRSTSGMASGGFQNAYGGGYDDAFVVKFNPNGTRRWASYYGGNQGDEAITCAVDGSDNIYLAGMTQSPNLAIGGHQATYGGAAEDGFVVKVYDTAIVTGSITGLSFCAGDSLRVPFASIDTFYPGNVYTAQLSDTGGSFAAPVAIGWLADTAHVDTVAAVIPAGAITGTGYRVRVVSSGPRHAGTDNGTSLNIHATVVPAVSISAVPGTRLGPNDNVTFTANYTDGGPVPRFQWKRNGTDIAGATDSAYSTNSSMLADNDLITVSILSNANCATSVPVLSPPDTIYISTGVPGQNMLAGLILSPNPVSTQLNIAGWLPSGYANGELTIRLTDIVGRTVFRGVVQVVNHSVAAALNVRTVGNGLYQLHADAGSYSEVRQLLIIH